MAIVYTVCENDAAKSVTMSFDDGSVGAPIFYTDPYGCSVEEYRRTLTFTITSGGASDENFRVYYKYREVVEQDNVEVYDSGTPPNRTGYIDMLAGETVATKVVVAEQYKWCGEESSEAAEYNYEY